MSTLLRQYEDGIIDLHRLKTDLIALLDCLETMEKPWCDALRSECWEFEQVLADDLDDVSGPKLPQKEREKIISQAINNIRSALDSLGLSEPDTDE